MALSGPPFSGGLVLVGAGTGARTRTSYCSGDFKCRERLARNGDLQRDRGFSYSPGPVSLQITGMLRRNIGARMGQARAVAARYRQTQKRPDTLRCRGAALPEDRLTPTK